MLHAFLNGVSVRWRVESLASLILFTPFYLSHLRLPRIYLLFLTIYFGGGASSGNFLTFVFISYSLFYSYFLFLSLVPYFFLFFISYSCLFFFLLDFFIFLLLFVFTYSILSASSRTASDFPFKLHSSSLFALKEERVAGIFLLLFVFSPWTAFCDLEKCEKEENTKS